jgi:Tfp pilus assembly protein PilF
MKLLRFCVIFVMAVLALSGCGRKKEISSLERKQAEHIVSEAQFAMTVKDYARAAGLFDQASKLCPDTGQYWVGLGSTRLRLGDRDGARGAYKQALKAFEAMERTKKSDPESALQQVYVLALLGRGDDAHALQAKLATRYPNDPSIHGFVEGKQLDRLLADPQFKASSL